MTPSNPMARKSNLTPSPLRLFAMAAAASLLTLVPRAEASTLTYDLAPRMGSGTALPTLHYGTVTLTGSGPDVLVTVALTPNEGFGDTGAGASLLWNMSNPSLSISGLTPGFSVVGGTQSAGGWTVDNAEGGVLPGEGAGGTGEWDFALTCRWGACGPGGSHPYTGALSFTIDNASVSDFMANGDRFYFASNICSLIGGNGPCAPGKNGGDIVAVKAGSSVSEPATLALFAAGLIGGALLIARRRMRRVRTSKAGMPH